MWEISSEVCGPQEAHHVIVWKAEGSNLVFYTDDRQITRRDPDWVQESLEMTVYMFSRLVPEKNSEKRKLMVFAAGFVL